ncbi:MAG: nitrile hydratase subunit beta [Rhizobiaceae bacterium]
MNGGADLGGMQGFGPVVDVPDEGNYHAEWESRVMGMVVALGACGQWNIDLSRHARESIPPADYLSFPYYKIWTEGVQKLMLERGMVTAEELSDGKLRTPAIKVRGRLEAKNVWDGLHSLSGAATRPEEGKPAFQIGDKIRTIKSHPEGHTRLPRYARNCEGVVTQILGFHVFPDSSGNGENPHWLYQVRFTAQELWGPDKNPRDTVTLDLWEPHFEKA